MLDLTFITRAADKARSRPYLWRQTLLPAAIVIALLLASVVAGVRATALLLLPLAIWIGVVLTTRFQGLTNLLVVTSALAIPFSIGTGTGSRINAAMLMLIALSGLSLLGLLVKQTRLPTIDIRWLAPVLLLIIVSLLAFLIGQLPWFDFATQASLVVQVGGLSLFILSAVGFLYAATHFQSIRSIEVTVWCFFVIGALYLGARASLTLRPHLGPPFAHGGIGSLFYLWLAALAFAQLLFNRQLSVRWKVALGALLLLLFYSTLGQTYRWRSGWLPALASVFVILALYSRRIAIPLIGVALTAAFPVARALIADDAYSFSTRVEAWQLVGEIIKVNPILGFGPANYYNYTQLFPIRGFSVAFNSHNQYVDILAQTGILGLLVYLWFFFEMARLAWYLRQRVPEGFPRAYVYGCLGGIAGTLTAGMLGDWVIPFVYNVGFNGFRSSVLVWIFLGGLAALARLISAESPAIPELAKAVSGEER